MSTPRVKRQFAGTPDLSQRQITSFFNPQSPNEPQPSPEPARQPVLPSTVQANLLSVGMRVRKSVPEGYKTTGTSAFKLWTDNAPVPTSTPRRAVNKATSRELLPFCGINKVGGLDTQPEFEQEDDVPDADAIPELSMSQESTESVDSNETYRKRFFEDDEELNASSHAQTMVGEGDSRVYAIPVSQAQKAARLGTGGQGRTATGSDFEDAEFLVYGDETMDQAN
ncbi:hypothetical protein NW754_009244 [Fusarium falciforme]|uniref:Uncharacterized protein n=1 Tax=Fusarium falciforme TaxID=195108 RepID=A0A9W8RBV4_9HYPO|nr:hypothetical protein NW754_009244 [Fusarium falciforme]KAJ4191662.1 hypothetical protein NW755_004848 [Fusarium falciforme]